MAKASHTSLARGLQRSQTQVESLLWARLQNGQLDGLKFRRQEPIGAYIVDFVCFSKHLIVELDGSQHGEALERVKDEERTAWLESQDFRVVRFWDSDVLQSIEGVLEGIWLALAEHSPSPNLSHQGRGILFKSKRKAV